MRTTKLSHQFVEFIPDTIQERTLYVSVKFATVVHKCCCGCGKEVVTPLSPTDWKLTYDGKTISLAPSIGNWGLECRSHYWIRNNRVYWAPSWSQWEIQAGRAHDRISKEEYFGTGPKSQAAVSDQPPIPASREEGGMWSILSKLWRRSFK
ncbi:MAG: hypothetical protein AMXMBFR82_06850 [Candidatus Hydrogenedentota bacterium]